MRRHRGFCEVETNLEEAVREAIQELIDRALEVAKDVPALIKDRAALDNEDVDGNQMPVATTPEAEPHQLSESALCGHG